MNENQEIMFKENISDKDEISESINFYKKEGREIVPVLDKQKNIDAKEKLDLIKKSKIYKNIPSKYKNNWNEVSLFHTKGDVDKANAILIDPKEGAFSIENKLNDLTGKEWTKFVKSWFVFDAIHSDLMEEKKITSQFDLNSEEHPATFSPTMIEKFINFFTKENQIVLDPFLGIGTTLASCDRTNRRGVGIELNKKYYKISKVRSNQLVINGNSLKIGNILKKNNINNIDFCISSPPYWDILNRSTGSYKKVRDKNNLDIKYSEDKKFDLGNINNYEDFINKLASVYFQIFDFLNNKSYLVIIVKNIKKDGVCYPIAWDISKKLSEKYILKDEKIWCQDKIGLAPFGYPYAWTSNIVHHYCLIFRKEV